MHSRDGHSSPIATHPYLCTLLMKRKELERLLLKLGWRPLRRGGRHDIWARAGAQEAIPRHRDINERLAMAILRRASRTEHSC